MSARRLREADATEAGRNQVHWGTIVSLNNAEWSSGWMVGFAECKQITVFHDFGDAISGVFPLEVVTSSTEAKSLSTTYGDFMMG